MVLRPNPPASVLTPRSGACSSSAVSAGRLAGWPGEISGVAWLFSGQRSHADSRGLGVGLGQGRPALGTLSYHAVCWV